MTKEDYDKFILGKGDDIGSRRALQKRVVELAKKRGYHTAEFYKMSKKQLRAIYYNLKNR